MNAVRAAATGAALVLVLGLASTIVPPLGHRSFDLWIALAMLAFAASMFVLLAFPLLRHGFRQLSKGPRSVSRR